MARTPWRPVSAAAVVAAVLITSASPASDPSAGALDELAVRLCVDLELDV